MDGDNLKKKKKTYYRNCHVTNNTYKDIYISMFNISLV